MSRGPELPSVAQLLDIAEDFGIDMTAERAGEYRDAMSGGIRAMRRIDDLPEDQPEVKYPRTPGRRPRADENPYNAWYWLTDIKGAKSGPLAGMRIGVKDTVSVAGVPMMNGSRVLEGHVPQIDATVVTRLLDAGAVIAGKTASADFSFSSGGHTSAYGPIRNPHKPTHSPGGSSKGSAAALAAGDVKMALGGDQGGSIRIPAAWCGVVGHKPTYGLVPYTGCMGMELSIDIVGPMADSVENVARMLSVLAGPDPYDPRQRGVIPENYVRDYLPAIGQGCEGLRIGVVEEGFGHKADTWPDLKLRPSDRRVDAKVRATINGLKKNGAKLRKVSVPMHYDGIRIWFALAAEGALDVMYHRAGLGSNWQGYYDTPLLDHVGKSLKARAQRHPDDRGQRPPHGRISQAPLSRPLLRQGAEPARQPNSFLRRGAGGMRRASHADHPAACRADSAAGRAVRRIYVPLAQHAQQLPANERHRPSRHQRAVRHDRRAAGRPADYRPPFRRPHGAARRRRGREARRLARQVRTR